MINITYIYLVENINNDPIQVYIGQTRHPKQRNRAHKKTYGNDIIYTIIDQVNSISKLYWEPIESYWIEQFKHWGFNTINRNSGGGGPISHTDKMRKNQSILLTGKTRTEEVKQRISKSMMGKNTWSVGAHTSKPIIQYTLDGIYIQEYKSISEAIRQTKFQTINQCLLGKIKKSGGYKWKYKIS
jgi:hypothetical protein